MPDPNFVVVEPTPEPENSSAKRATVRTAIKFPYADLDAAVVVAKKIFEKGGTSGETVQVAAWLGHGSVDSGAFRTRTGAAQTFGLISTRPGTIELTVLGSRVVDPKTEAGARIAAFLSVPLYHRIYETFKVGMLPKDIGLESEMQKLGVPPKQTETARQIFARSAKQAGFFEEGADRLVKPVVHHPSGESFIPDTSDQRTNQRDESGGDEGGGGDSDSRKTIVLRGGGELTLIASVNFMSMPKEDRNFVFELIDKLDDYAAQGLLAERATPEPTPVAQAAV